MPIPVRSLSTRQKKVSLLPESQPATASRIPNRPPKQPAAEGQPSGRVKPGSNSDTFQHAAPSTSTRLPTRTHRFGAKTAKTSDNAKRQYPAAPAVDKASTLISAEPASTLNPSTQHSSRRSSLAQRTVMGAISRPPVSTKGKPAFITYQQHYSPQKQPPPRPLSAESNRSRNTENGNMVVESTSRSSRQELFELTIVHSTSQTSIDCFVRSASKHLEELYQEVSSQYQLVQTLEDAHKTQQSQISLRGWLSQDSTTSAREKLHRIASSIQILSDLVAPHGLSTVVFQEYDQWLETVTRTLEKRRATSQESVVDTDIIITSLGLEWTQTASHLQEYLGRQLEVLESLPQAAQDYGIGATINIHNVMAQQMLESLEICISTQELVLLQERDWIASRVQQIRPGQNGAQVALNVRIPVWEQPAQREEDMGH